MAHTFNFDTDLLVFTRNAIKRTFVDQVFMTSPVLSLLILNNRVNMKGGDKLDVPVKKARGTSNFQVYEKNDELNAGRTNRYEMAQFPYGMAQVPVEYGIEDIIENTDADRDAKMIDLVSRISADCMDEMHDGMIAEMYDTDHTEGDAGFNSICAALDHDVTYGGLSRATTATRQWWQGASYAGTFSDRSTSRSASIDTLRVIDDKAGIYDKGNPKKIVVVPTTLFRVFLREAEANKYQMGDGMLAEYGHRSVKIDGREIVEDKWLESQSRTTELYFLNPETWKFEANKRRNFTMTPFKWQGDIVGGKDKWLARIMVAGRLYCDRPNSNMWLSTVA